jgi:hypothetical protein
MGFVGRLNEHYDDCLNLDDLSEEQGHTNARMGTLVTNLYFAAVLHADLPSVELFRRTDAAQEELMQNESADLIVMSRNSELKLFHRSCPSEFRN